MVLRDKNGVPEEVRFSHKAIAEQDVRDLATVTTIHSVVFYCCDVSDEAVVVLAEAMPQLSKLLLVACLSVSNSSLVALASLKNLEHLNVKDTGLSRSGIRELRERLPNTKIVA